MMTNEQCVIQIKEIKKKKTILKVFEVLENYLELTDN